jgi:hypothetical protein
MARDAEPLVCPSCATTHALDLRFCPDCGMPLTYGGVVREERPESPLHERMRKVKPQYAEGTLVRVATGRQQPEAEMIQGMLLEEGVPSTLKRSIGFDVPDMLAAGPRDVMVPASGVATAREVLLQSDLHDRGDGRPIVDPRKLLIGLLAGIAVVAIILLAASALS